MANSINITVYVHNSSNITVQNCVMKNSASHAISVDDISPNVTVLGNTYSMVKISRCDALIHQWSPVEFFLAKHNTHT